MAIRHISKSEFDEFKPSRHPMLSKMATEKIWLRDDGKNVIGAVFQDRGDNDWGWVVLGRDERGDFRAIAVEASVPERAAAERAVIKRMEAIEQSGETEFPQGD